MKIIEIYFLQKMQFFCKCKLLTILKIINYSFIYLFIDMGNMHWVWKKYMGIFYIGKNLKDERILTFQDLVTSWSQSRHVLTAERASLNLFLIGNFKSIKSSYTVEVPNVITFGQRKIDNTKWRYFIGSCLKCGQIG